LKDLLDPREESPWTQPPPAAEEAVGGQNYGVRHLMFLVLGCAFLFWLLANVGWGFGVALVLVVGFALAMATVAVLLQRFGTQQDAMLWAVAKATEKRMPLAPGIEAFAELCAGLYRHKARALARLLESGVPLPVAAERIPGVLPPAAVVYIYLAKDPAILSRTLADLGMARASWKPFRNVLRMRVLYFFWVLSWLAAAATFMMIWIVPKFQRIFQDFGVPLPPLTQNLISLSDQMSGGLFLIGLIASKVLLLLSLLFLISDWLSWNFPLVVWFSRRRHGAIILRGLAIGVESGRPLTGVVELLGDHYPNVWVRWRLRKVLRELRDGSEWTHALRKSGFLRSTEAAVLDSAQRAGNLSWALREMAEGIDRRMGYRLQVLAQVLFPIVIIALGAVVFLFVAALFSPLIQLIQDMAE
jgi:type II secretory pathway component PulF